MAGLEVVEDVVVVEVVVAVVVIVVVVVVVVKDVVVVVAIEVIIGRLCTFTFIVALISGSSALDTVIEQVPAETP